MLSLPTWQEVIEAGSRGEFGPVWVRAAATIFQNGTYEGSRHWLIINQIISSGVADRVINRVHGFVLNDGRFVDREEAAKIALGNGQVKVKQFTQSYLFSEEIWR